MTPYHESDGQPEWCRKLVKAGWRFRYDPATRFDRLLRVLRYGVQRGYWLDWRIVLYDEVSK